MFREGDIVEIPLPDGRVALGWLLFTSEVFKDIVGFVVFGIKGLSRRQEFVLEKALHVLGPLYTNIVALDHYGWRKVAHQRVSEAQRLLTKRDVGGRIYIGDRCIGSAVDGREPKLPPMLVMGMPAVYERIAKAFPVSGAAGQGCDADRG
jgi:hypothetical protein